MPDYLDDGRTGTPLGKLVAAGTGGIDGPRVIEWKAKIDMCHRPPGNRAHERTLSISYMSGFDHLAHGDIVGACPG